MRLTKKTLALLLAVMMIFGGVVGGTVAWLVSTTETVTNTFTVGDINITLTETNTNLDSDNDANTNSYKMIPGTAIAKDPTITVLAGSEACYVFLKVTETNNTTNNKKFIEYALATGWKELDDEVTGAPSEVYYQEIDARTGSSNSALTIGILGEYTHGADNNHKDVAYSCTVNQVLVNPDITKEEMKDVGTNLPSLSFVACAVQKDQLTLSEAWAQATFTKNS